MVLTAQLCGALTSVNSTLIPQVHAGAAAFYNGVPGVGPATSSLMMDPRHHHHHHAHPVGTVWMVESRGSLWSMGASIQMFRT